MREGLDRAVARVCPTWLADQREDLVQSAMIRIVRLWRTEEKSAPPGHAYLKKVAYTAVAAALRQRRRSPVFPLEEGDAHAPRARDGDPERRQEAAELGRAIRACLARLSQPRRAAVTLHLLGYPRERMATMLGWNLKQVDNHQHRGLADLRRCLDEKGHKP